MAKKTNKINLQKYAGESKDKNSHSHKKMAQYVEEEKADVQVQNEPEPPADPEPTPKKVPDPAGKAKSTRITMKFNLPVYEFLMAESANLCVNVSAYINEMIKNVDEKKVEAYYDSLVVKPSRSFVQRKGAEPGQRINITLLADTHDVLEKAAAKYNQTMTQYVNMIISAEM